MLEKINYTVRYSKRAKRPAMIYHGSSGLEVVVPVLMKFNIEKFVQQNSAWVQRQILKHPNNIFEYPKKITLFNQQIYHVRYVATTQPLTLQMQDDNDLLILGELDQDNFRLLITTWLLKLAKKLLPSMLASLSSKIGINYSKVSICRQKTIWGSCSSLGVIRLNYKLLLLPIQLVEYVMIHELCHIIHLNHSASFWRLVKQYHPHYLANKKLLRQQQYLLPAWL